MRNSLLIKLAASSMVVAGLTVAQNAYADSSGKAAAVAEKEAARIAAKAEKALAKDPARAVVEAEHAVALAPQSVEHRVLLGRAYLATGRFRAAAAAFGDVLTLDPAHAGAALRLALARVALGDADGARALVDAHEARIPAGDRGLALTLAGDAPGGAAVLEAAVRAGGADATTRQNLAFAYAMSGRWMEAKLMASYDLDPQTVSRRIMDWSRLAREEAAPAQVAFLLGVTPAEDPGMPTRLALAPATVVPLADVPVQLASVAPPPPPARIEDSSAFDAVAGPAPAPAVPVMVVAPASDPAPATGIVFAAPREIVQPIARRQAVAAAPAPAPAAAAAFRPASYVVPAGGRFAVQLGAYSSPERVEAGWSRAVAALAALDRYTPSSAAFRNGNATLYRLSVSGFPSRAAAADLCVKLKAAGRACFVREVAGDAPLQWAGRGKGVRVAVR